MEKLVAYPLLASLRRTPTGPVRPTAAPMHWDRSLVFAMPGTRKPLPTASPSSTPFQQPSSTPSGQPSSTPSMHLLQSRSSRPSQQPIVRPIDGTAICPISAVLSTQYYAVPLSFQPSNTSTFYLTICNAVPAANGTAIAEANNGTICAASMFAVFRTNAASHLHGVPRWCS